MYVRLGVMVYHEIISFSTMIKTLQISSPPPVFKECGYLFMLGLNLIHNKKSNTTTTTIEISTRTPVTAVLTASWVKGYVDHIVLYWYCWAGTPYASKVRQRPLCHVSIGCQHKIQLLCRLFQLSQQEMQCNLCPDPTFRCKRCIGLASPLFVLPITILQLFNLYFTCLQCMFTEIPFISIY